MQGIFVVLLMIFVFCTALAKSSAKKTKEQQQANAKKAAQQKQLAAEHNAAVKAAQSKGGSQKAAVQHMQVTDGGEGEDPCHDHLYGEVQPFGSIGEDTEFTEGFDPCHDDLFAGTTDAGDWEDVHMTAGDAVHIADADRTELLRAVIMADVLGRPVSQRRPRRMGE